MHLEGIYISMTIWMLIERIYMVLNRNCIKHVLYHVYTVRFSLLDNIFLTQQGCQYNKYQKGNITIY